MSLVYAWAGAQTDDGFRAVCKVTGAAVRLAVSDQVTADGGDLALLSPQFFDAGDGHPTAQGMASATATGLDPDTVWYWQIEEDSTLTGPVGRVRTHPPQGQPASFTFAAAACAGADSPTDVSNHEVFDIMAGRSDDWLFFAHLGDLHYRNIAVDDPALYRAAVEDVLTFNGTLGTDARQANFYRKLGLVYQWDDHDYGPNDSDRTNPGRPAAQQVYRETVPHYPLVDTDGIQQSWQVGRVLFIADDHRSFRDPNTDQDGPDKTMLGARQIQWMDSLLAASDAQVLVWFTEHWTNTSDTWALYRTEADEVRTMLAERGFLDRMIVVSGDIHQLAIDSGAGGDNLWGVPQFQFASLDSADAGPGSSQFDLGARAGRSQYGTVEVVDDGDTITMVGSGWIGHDLWQSHTITFSLSGDPGAGPGQSVASIQERVTWLGCDVTSGKIIAELPSLEGQVSRALGAETSSACSTPIPLSGPDAIGPQAFQATEPKRTMVVAVVNDVPAWAGIVLRRDGGTDAQLQLATVSPEGYLNRRKVRDHSFSGVDEAVIMSTLARDAEDIGGVGQGLGLVHDIQITGQRRTRTYLADDKVSVLQRMKELSRVIGGPEWAIDPEWADADKTVVQLVLRIADRIGKASDNPDAVFQATFDARSAGASSYSLTEDHTDGRGANWVVAWSTGEGDDRAESVPHIDHDQLGAGVPIFEHHFSPGSDIGQDTLDGHAAGELVRLKDGTLGLKITSRWDQFPRFGVDFRLGDDVAWDLIGHRHPDGFTGKGRLIGWELDLAAGTLSPTLTGIQDG